MARRLVALVVAALLAMTVVGAAGCTGSTPTPLELTQKDSGSTKQLAVGQTMKISLDSNPTTGYRWGIDSELPPQLQQVGEPIFTPSSSAMGASGTEVWTFSGKSAGNGELKLKYFRSFEPTATPPQAFSVTIDVR